VSGFVRGKIECLLYTPGNNLTITQNAFKVIYDFFASHPNYTITALQYGSTGGPATSGAGTGTGFHDQPNSFGYHAFFVARANATSARPYDVYHLFQWCGSVNQGGGTFGSSPGNPGLVNGSTSPIDNNHTYIGYACAIGIGGTGGSALSPSNGSPWKGTTNANGADTKGTVVWGAPAGGGTGVIMFPRSNNGEYGSHRQLTQNTGGIASYGNTIGGPSRYSMVGDDDSFIITIDGSDNGNYTLNYSGLFTPRNGLTMTYPYCSVFSYNNLPWTVTAESVYGDVAGTSAQQGGIVSPLTASVYGMQLDHYASFATDTNFWPNHAFSSPTFDELDIPIGIYESAPTNRSGLMGQLDFVRELYNVQTNGVKSDFSRIFVGSTTLQDRKYSVPWDTQNRTVPRSGDARNGITFVNSSGA
jgi:hypothetical protein